MLISVFKQKINRKNKQQRQGWRKNEKNINNRDKDGGIGIKTNYKLLSELASTKLGYHSNFKTENVKIYALRLGKYLNAGK